MIDRPPSLAYLRQHFPTLLPYLIAGAIYIGIGVLEPRFLLSWAEGIIFLFFAVWAVPALFRRLYRRFRR
jgi:hypothetical protein